ncbi:hypothetical protein ACIA8C_13260 [Nocardia sp. NPDC051321]|uniref:hypothetical protein n=1 Tax=Nocardia sp. NPDC051321 TaxID=3364323 RepID=UPI0037A9D4BF
MSAADGNSSDRVSPIDDDYVGNLDALTRDLEDIEMIAASALSDKPIDHAATQRIVSTSTGLTYSDLTTHHQQRREVEGWGESDIADILDPIALRQRDGWRAAQRVPWERGDLVVVGVSGLIGALGNLYDSQVDAAVLSGLSLLKRPTCCADGRGRPPDSPSITPARNSAVRHIAFGPPGTTSAGSSTPSIRSALGPSKVRGGKTDSGCSKRLRQLAPVYRSRKRPSGISQSRFC